MLYVVPSHVLDISAGLDVFCQAEIICLLREKNASLRDTKVTQLTLKQIKYLNCTSGTCNASYLPLSLEVYLKIVQVQMISNYTFCMLIFWWSLLCWFKLAKYIHGAYCIISIWIWFIPKLGKPIINLRAKV